MSNAVSQDIFICMFYNKDTAALRKLLRCFLQELAKQYDCKDLVILNENLPTVGVRALFLLLITTDPRLRYWAMQYQTKTIHKPPPKKVSGFLRTLRDDIVPKWMSDERKTAAMLVRQATELYIKS